LTTGLVPSHGRDVFIRYFARTDDSDLGRAAAAYCDALVATGAPVRVVSARVAELQLDKRGRSSSAWDRHRDLLITPMNGDYVNVVCGEPADWARFHTANVTNALLLTEQNLDPVKDPLGPTLDLVLVGAIALYGLAYAPSSELANAVERITAYRPIVVPLGTPDAGGAFLRLKL
jgi:hypothetical protein